MKIQNLLFAIIIYCLSPVLYGFSGETLVKSNNNYVPINQLNINDQVICYDFNQGYTEKPITDITSHPVDTCICLTINQQQVRTLLNQLFYVSREGVWKKACELEIGDTLSASTDDIIVEDIKIINQSIELFDITVENCHNFLILHDDILVHNFFPVVIGIGCAFGSGALECTGISAGVAALGCLVGFTLHRDKQSKKYKASPQISTVSSGFTPHDPDEERKKKLEQRSLNNKEARKKAKELGYKEVKNAPFNTQGAPVFQKGDRFISPDRTCHKGGVWKVFERGIGRNGTWDLNLTTRIGG